MHSAHSVAAVSARQESSRRSTSARKTPGLHPSADHLVGEAFHLLELRAALQQQQIHAGARELCYTFGDLISRTSEPSAETTVRDRIVLEAHLLLELCVRDPVAIVVIPR